MLIQVFHVEDCPHLPITMETLEEVIQELHIDPKIEKILVKTQEDADRLKFLGSTSIRVDGEDIDPYETKVFPLN